MIFGGPAGCCGGEIQGLDQLVAYGGACALLIVGATLIVLGLLHLKDMRK